MKKGLLLLCACTCITASAQIKEDWYLKKVLDNSNGLQQNSVSSMYFDRKTGFLWMATESGIIRYDGVDPLLFDKRNLPGLKSGRMSVFFSTVKEGVFVIDKNGGSTLYSINGPVPREFKKDSIENSYLLGTYFRGSFSNVSMINGIFSYKQNLNRLNSAKYDFFSAPITLLALTDSTWLSFSNTQFRFFTDSTLTASWAKPANEIPILIEQDKKVYALNDNGTGFLIDPEMKTCKRITSADTAFLRGKPIIYYDPANSQPLLLNGDKLYKIRFNGNTVTTEYVSTLKNLPASIFSIIMDPGGKLIFVATELKGLYVYEKNPFRTYKGEGKLDIVGKMNSDRNNVYSCVMPDTNHIITNTCVLFNLASGSFSILPFVHQTPLAMLVDKEGCVWHTSRDSISKYRTETNKTSFYIKLPLSKTSTFKYNIMQTILQASNGRIWISTSEYLGYVDHDKLIDFIGVDRAKGFELTCLAESPEGELFGGNNKGIWRIDTINKKLVPLENVNIKSIRSIYIDKDRHCWITTYGNGFFLYDFKSRHLHPFPVDSKGYLLYSHVLCEDGIGNFLVPTNRGLFRINKTHLLNIAGGNEEKLFYQYFDINSGLEGNEFNGGCSPAYNRLPNGDILFPSLDGLVRVNVQALPDVRNYPIFINRVETKDTVYTGTGQFSFGKNERTLTWHLCFAQWEQLYSPGLSYRLDNDTSWSYVQEGLRSIQLTDLKGGKHVLHIRFKTGFSPTAYSTLTVPFQIKKKYYEFPLFWIICFGLMLVIIYASVRIKTRNLNKRNADLENKITEKTKELVDKNEELNDILTDLQQTNYFKSRLISLLGHDIMIPLQYIGKVASQLKMYHEQLSKDTITGSVGDIHITSTQILLYCESIIHWVKIQNSKFIPQINSAFLVADMLSELTAFHLPFNNEKSNRIIIESPADLSFLQDPLLVKIILHNLLLNANKFTNGGTITVRADKKNDWLVLSVEDTGRGMTKEKVMSLNNFNPINSNLGTNEEKGFGVGYTIIMDLLKFSNGAFYVESTVNKGTKVTIELPSYAKRS